MSFDEYATSKKFVDLVRRTIRQEIAKERPAPSYGTVTSVDIPNRMVFVLFPGETESIGIQMSTPFAPLVGHVVRVEGITGDRYVKDVVVNVDGDGNATPVEPIKKYKFWNDDIFPISQDGPQTLPLTYEPDPQSLHVEVRGITARKNTEWVLDRNYLALLSPLNIKNGDIVYTEYAYTEDVAAIQIDTTPWLKSFGSGTNAQPTLPVGAVAGQLAIIFIAHDPLNTITNNGWTLHESEDVTHLANANVFTYNLTVLSKVLSGSDTLPSVAFTNNNTNVVACVVKPSFGTVVDSDQLVTPDDSFAVSPTISGDYAVRGWMTVSVARDIVLSGRAGNLATVNTGGLDIDLAVVAETETIQDVATLDAAGTAGWVALVVGVV